MPRAKSGKKSASGSRWDEPIVAEPTRDEQWWPYSFVIIGKGEFPKPIASKDSDDSYPNPTGNPDSTPPPTPSADTSSAGPDSSSLPINRDAEFVKDCVSDIARGTRRLFRLITYDDIIAQCKEVGKSKNKPKEPLELAGYEACAQACAQLDDKEAGGIVSPVVLSRVVKLRLIQERQEQLEKREEERIAREEAAAAAAASGSAAGGGKSAKKDKKSAKGKKGKGGGGDSNAAGKRKSKLKKRSEVDDSVPTIDDEPKDGPDVYYCFSGFRDSSIVEALTSCGVGIDAIVTISSDKPPVETDIDENNDTATDSGASEDNEYDTFFWDSLKAAQERARTGHLLRELAWVGVHVGGGKANDGIFMRGDEIFAAVCKEIYTLLTHQKQHKSYLKRLALVPIPEAPIPEAVDMRLYNRLMDAVPAASFSIATMMDAILQQVDMTIDTEVATEEFTLEEDLQQQETPKKSGKTKKGAKEEPVVDPTPTSSVLSEYLDEALSSLSHSLHTAAPSPPQRRDSVLTRLRAGTPLIQSDAPLHTVIRYGDKIRANTYFLQMPGGYNSTEAQRNFQNLSHGAKLCDVLWSKVNTSKSEQQRSVVKHELNHFCRLPFNQVERVTLQLAFENLLDSHETGCSDNPWNLDSFCCKEELDRNQLLQILTDELAVVDRPIYKYLPDTNQIILALIPKMDDKRCDEIEFTSSSHTPIAFGNYIECLATNSSNDSDTVDASTNTTLNAYDVGDQLLRLIGHKSSMFPTGNGQIDIQNFMYVKGSRYAQKRIADGGNLLTIHSIIGSEKSKSLVCNLRDGTLVVVSEADLPLRELVGSADRVDVNDDKVEDGESSTGGSADINPVEENGT
eukprot:UC4_evm1s863